MAKRPDRPRRPEPSPGDPPRSDGEHRRPRADRVILGNGLPLREKAAAGPCVFCGGEVRPGAYCPQCDKAGGDIAKIRKPDRTPGPAMGWDAELDRARRLRRRIFLLRLAERRYRGDLVLVRKVLRIPEINAAVAVAFRADAEAVRAEIRYRRSLTKLHILTSEKDLASIELRRMRAERKNWRIGGDRLARGLKRLRSDLRASFEVSYDIPEILPNYRDLTSGLIARLISLDSEGSGESIDE